MSDNTFKKRKGTTDKGKDYEEYFPSWVILRLLQNKEVKDFLISANDEQFGAFDHFILELKYTNKTEERYVTQLKHKDKNCIQPNDFKNKKADFYLRKYYESFEQNKQSLSKYNIILFTNTKFREVDNIDIDVGKDGENVKLKLIECIPSPVINTLEHEGKCYQFQLDPGNSEKIKEKYKHFFESLFLYTNQMNIKQLQDNILQQLKIFTHESYVADKFLKFIHHWSLADGIKNKLTKNMMAKVLTLNLFDELIYPFTSCNVNEKQKIFQKAVSHFNISVFNNESLNKIQKVWGDAKSILRNCGIKKINDIRKQFEISTRFIREVQDINDLNDEECSKLLWLMDICPLIIKHHHAAYEAAKLCGKNSKFIFITDELNDDKLEKLTVFKTLSDLKRHQPTYNDFLKKFTFRLFGEKTSFEELIKEDPAFENLITTVEIAQITDNTDLVRLEEEKLCFPYVERSLYKNIINFKYLQNLHEKTMVLISNVSDEKRLRDDVQHFEIVPILNELYKDTDDTNNKNKFQISNDTFSKTYEQLSNRTDWSRDEFNGQLIYGIQDFGTVSINETRDKLQNDVDIIENEKKFNTSHGVSLNKYKLFINKTEASPEKFKKLCDKEKKYHNFHHLRYHDKYFEWIESIGDVSELQKFSIRSDTFVNNEEKYGEDITSKLNIIIGDPGIGKTLLLKKLKNNLLSKYLSVIILPTDVPKLCKFMEHSKIVQKFFDFILETKFSKYGNFERQILKLVIENREAVFLWDALDELSEQNRIFVEELIVTLRENSIGQFLTSRRYLQKHLENKYNVLCHEIQPFVDKEQTNYIEERLRNLSSNEELKAIITFIKKNIADTPYRDILGVPLQIYILTELFLQDFTNRRSNFFTITDFFYLLIEKKIDLYLKKKRNFPQSYNDDTLIEENLSLQIKNYQVVAIKAIFRKAFSIESYTNPDFLNKIKDKGDKFGLITAVDMNMQPEFLHNSYAEYFAATYLAENCRKISNLDIIFERKYTNVRYFFDLLLAKNSPVHVAVLCKNLKYLQDYDGRDELRSKDLQGRNALHLAASWGERYPLLETSETSEDSTLSQKSIFGSTIFINDLNNFETRQESTEYHQIIHLLSKNCDPKEIDELFNFTPSIYAERCECLFAAAIIGQAESKSYLKTKDERFINSLLYYAIKYEIFDILTLFDDMKVILNKNLNSILQATVNNNHPEYHSKLLSQPIYRQNMNYRNRLGDTALLTAAQNEYSIETMKYLSQYNENVDSGAEHLHLEIVKSLIQENTNVNGIRNNDRKLFHCAVENEHPKIVTNLISKIADMKAGDNNGGPSLHLAGDRKHFETSEYLIQEETNIKANKVGWTPLHSAAENGHLETVKYLIEKEANVNAVDADGWIPLHFAVENGHLETVEYLIKRHANVNAADNYYKFTPLHLAVGSGHLKTVKYLIKEKINVNAVDHNGRTPLHLAAFLGYLETVKYLIEENFNVNAVDNDGRTPLHLAAEYEHLEIVEYLIQQSANVNAAANEGETPLFLAAFNGHLETVKYLKQQNAKIDAAIKNSFTPLMIAAENGHLETVEFLIQQSTNVDAAANEGETPLFLAAFNGHFETVKYLKQQNAKVDAATKDGFTPLMVAAENGHIKTVNYLIEENGANIKATASDGTTLLWSAAFGGILKTVAFLLEQNLDVNAAGVDGLTPLMTAVQEGHLSIVQLLITRGARINIYDKHFETPLTKACKRGHERIVKFLIKSGANVNIARKDKITPTNNPINVAFAKGHKKIVQMLLNAGATFTNLSAKGHTSFEI